MSLEGNFYNFSDVVMTNRKLTFTTWIPTISSVKKRMMTASTKPLIKTDIFKQKFELDFSTGDRLDLELDEIFKDIQRMRQFKGVTKIE